MATPKKFRSLPQFVTYEGHTYRLVFKKILFDENDGTELRGTVDTYNKVIEISRRQSLSSQWETIFHEFCHEFLVHRVELQPDVEETICESVSRGLFQLFVDNGWLKIVK